jgi:hypothetical protein
MNELHLTEDFLDRMVRAVEKVRERLNRAVSALEMVGALRVVALEPLVKMNLTSFRHLERMLLRDMIDVGLVDDSWLPMLPEELAARLSEVLDNPGG